MSKEEIALNLVKSWLEQRPKNSSYMTLREITEYYLECLNQLKNDIVIHDDNYLPF